MITIVYSVDPSKVEDEKEWLRLQRVTATLEMDWDWDQETNGFKQVAKFGMIVNSDAALAIKLRHNLDLQFKYQPR